MLYDWKNALRVNHIQDVTVSDSILFEGNGLWVVLLSSGEGTFALNPPLKAEAGMLAIGRDNLPFVPAESCHLLAVQLEGRIPSDFAAGLPDDVYLARGESCPHAAQLMGELQHAGESITSTQMAFALICELGNADAAAPALPPLVAQAVEDIRANYAGLYGVEELSERLGVSKSHLVRAFHSAVGVSPGKYLTAVRIGAAKQLLLHREYSLDVIASLCGFSGANYLCRVFKKETGVSPAAWRASALSQGAVLPTSEAEHSMYI